MKQSILLAVLCSLALITISWTSIPDHTVGIEIEGKWKLEIDNKIDGSISGNHGCETIVFTSKGRNSFSGKYGSCNASTNAKSSQFSGNIYITSRGNLISMIQNNQAASQYYANWSGKLFESNEILGIWTDVEGNQGEFRLSR